LKRDILLKETERLDDLLCHGLKIIQDREDFCFSLDAVLLANFVTVKKGERVIDLGTGSGVIPLLLSAKTGASYIAGVEIQERVAERARRSVRYNGLEERVKILTMDLKDAPQLLENDFDVVVTNPPYMEVGRGFINPQESKAISKHEIKCSLEDVIRVGAFLLKSKGRFAIVHKPERLVDLMCLMRKYALEPKKIKFAHPKVGKAPNILLIEALKGGKPQLKFCDPVYIHKEDGTYTDELMGIFYGPQEKV
jgi:tRNA1Val (adenine37-N6)-methyltransferase